jgi:hypothetical protein
MEGNPMSNSRGRFIARLILGLLLCAGLALLGYEAHPLLNRLHALHAQRPNIAPRFPVFTVRASTNIDDSLGSDAPGSTLIDNNGAFHFFATLSQYDNADKSDAFVKTYTNTDMGEMNRHPKGNVIVTDDTFIKTPGALCYKIDKRAVNPIETPFEDDRCDVIGTWIDHDTGTWYGVVHDEYFFNPWSAKDKGNVLSGVHFDRLMYATSTNQGASWQLQDEILTSPFGDHATTTAFPGKTWYFGDGDPRLFVDYSTGYFYVYYYSRIFLKNGARVASYTDVARAPISGKMAKGTWNKWYGGAWTQPGIGGLEAPVDSDLAMTYTPANDTVTFSGTGVDGAPLVVKSYLVPSSGRWEFSDPTTKTAYYIDLKRPRKGWLGKLARQLGFSTPSIVNAATGATVRSVSYVDASIGQQVIVQIINDLPQVTFVDQKTGATLVQTPDANMLSYRVQGTNGLYGATQANGAVVTFNTYLNQYLSVSDVSNLSIGPGNDGTGVHSDLYVWSNTDLGDQNGWKLIGALPANVDYGYYNWIMDSGSLTSSLVTGSSFRRYDLDVEKFWDFSFPSSTSGLTYFGTPVPLFDSKGTPLSSRTSYTISQAKAPAVGQKPSARIELAGPARQWKIQSIPDPFNPSMPSGFYRIVDAASGAPLHVLSSASGGTDAASLRAVSAKVGVQGYVKGSGNPTALGDNKTPGGSDEWFFEPVANTVPATLTTRGAQPASANATTLNTANKAYKIVNRNSGLALDFSSGAIQLSPDHFGADPKNGNPAYRTNLSVTITSAN